jgi:hypothetical protein
MVKNGCLMIKRKIRVPSPALGKKAVNPEILSKKEEIRVQSV